MVFSKMYNQMDILETAMQASNIKNQVIQNNIANAELPNYKKSNVVFENVLEDVVNDFKRTGVLDLSVAKPKIVVDHQNSSYRLDGNNVDIETEMVALYKNSAKYDVMTSAVINDYKRINLVLNLK